LSWFNSTTGDDRVSDEPCSRQQLRNAIQFLMERDRASPEQHQNPYFSGFLAIGADSLAWARASRNAKMPI
jgi:hypothetical protein